MPGENVVASITRPRHHGIECSATRPPGGGHFDSALHVLLNHPEHAQQSLAWTLSGSLIEMKTTVHLSQSREILITDNWDLFLLPTAEIGGVFGWQFLFLKDALYLFVSLHGWVAILAQRKPVLSWHSLISCFRGRLVSALAIIGAVELLGT